MSLDRPQRARRVVYAFTADVLKLVADGTIRLGSMAELAAAANVEVEDIVQALDHVGTELRRRTQGRGSYSTGQLRTTTVTTRRPRKKPSAMPASSMIDRDPGP